MRPPEDLLLTALSDLPCRLKQTSAETTDDVMSSSVPLILCLRDILTHHWFLLNHFVKQSLKAKKK